MSASSEGIPQRVGPYRVDGLLGEGGMGTVYRGHDDRLDRPVALKHVRRDLDRVQTEERFQLEARAIARLNHPAVVQIYDWVEDDDGCWFVMELVEGTTLRRTLSKGPLPFARVVEIGLAIADGLGAAHEAGLIHRDLKPENVMLVSDGRVKILDFGLAKDVRVDGLAKGLTGEGRVVGTATAMSPEQAAGREIDPRSDLFSLGALLYEAAVGVSPFERDSAVETLAQICSLPHVPASELAPALPRAFSATLDQLLEKEPRLRPANAHEVVRRLATFRRDGEPGIRDPSNEAGSRGQGGAGASHRSASTVATMVDGLRPRERRNTPSRSSTSERRQITVLAAELVDPEGRALEAELLADWLPELERIVAAVGQEWRAHVQHFGDDRLVLCFGYPSSTGDEARRAVLASFELIERLRRVTAREASLGDTTRPALRVAVDTGLTVVSTDGLRDRLILGSLLDRVLALGRRTGVDEILLSDVTHGLVGRFFECRVIADPDVEDPDGPRILGHRVLAAREGAAPGPDVDLVARREELDLLLGRWRRARSGEGQVALVSGAAGIGKSRLVRELASRLRREGHAPWILFGSPDGERTPFRPILSLLRRLLDDAGSPERPALEVLETILLRWSLEPSEVVPFLAPLLGIELGRFRPPDVGPRRHQERVMEILTALLLAAADEAPRLLVVEDLHWVDPSTLDLLARLVDEVEAAPVLLVLTFRPALEVPWERRAHLTQVHLGRLDAPETALLLEHFTLGRRVAPALVERLVEHTDGVPLFLEELVKSLLESEALREVDGFLEPVEPIDTLELPPTLRDLLSARLDRLGSAKRIAQVAAVVGRSLVPEILAEVGELSDADLEPELDRLVGAKLLLRRGWGSRRRYTFKHALVRQAASESLLPRERRRLHARVADALLAREAFCQRDPAEVARHLGEGGRPGPAADWWLRAGRRAIAQSSHREGVELFERGRACVERLPVGPERIGRELALATQLAAATSVLEGYSATRPAEHWEKARALTSQLEDSPELFWVLWGLWSFQVVRARLDEALGFAERLERIARRSTDPDLLLHARSALGLASYFRGDLERARHVLEAAVAEDDSERTSIRATVTGQDTGVTLLAALSLVRWHLGDEDGALDASRASIRLAEAVGHSYSLAFARSYAARLHQSRGDVDALRREATAVVELSRERGYFWITQGLFFLGCSHWAEAAGPSIGEDVGERAARLMDQGMAGYRSAGARLSETYMLAQRCELELARGRAEEARQWLDQATQRAAECSEGYWRPELHRLEGEWQMAHGNSVEAAAHVERSLEVATVTGDRAFQERAKATLSRWRREPGTA